MIKPDVVRSKAKGCIVCWLKGQLGKNYPNPVDWIEYIPCHYNSAVENNTSNIVVGGSSPSSGTNDYLINVIDYYRFGEG